MHARVVPARDSLALWLRYAWVTLLTMEEKIGDRESALTKEKEPSRSERTRLTEQGIRFWGYVVVRGSGSSARFCSPRAREWELQSRAPAQAR